VLEQAEFAGKPLPASSAGSLTFDLALWSPSTQLNNLNSILASPSWAGLFFCAVHP
jgi:hypothetical protein